MQDNLELNENEVFKINKKISLLFDAADNLLKQSRRLYCSLKSLNQDIHELLAQKL